MAERPAEAASGEVSRGSRALVSIQVLRAVAALGVLTHHTAVDIYLRYGGTVVLNNFVTGAAGVDLFFVISGFVMVYASESLFGQPGAQRVFMLRRLARVVPLYWAVTAVLLAYMVAAHRSWPPNFHNIQGVLASFAFIPFIRDDGLPAPIHALGWTLNYEMFFYLVFAAALVLSRRAAVFAVIAVFGLAIVIGRLFALPMPLAYWFDPIIVEFCFGMLIALAFRAGVRLPRAASVALVAAAIAAFCGSAVWGPNVAWRTLEWGVPSALLLAGLVLSRAAARPGPVTRGFAFLGDASYSLYLVHAFAFPIPRWTLARWIDFTPFPWALAPVYFAGSIATAIAAYLLFEKPITRALQRRLGHRPD